MACMLLIGCSQKGEYRRMIDDGLASGVRNDSIFIGLELGMTSKEFYTYCWELNKKELIKQGPGNLSVQYDLDSIFSEPAWMNFYPEFHEDKICKMPVRIRYKAWAPWNRRLFNDSLVQRDLLPFAESLYGKGFREFKHPEKPSVWVKVDGNRMVKIGLKAGDNQIAEMYVTDLTAKPQIDPVK